MPGSTRDFFRNGAPSALQHNMRSLIAHCSVALMLLGGTAGAVLGQTAGQDMKSAGQESKSAAKDTGRAVKKTTRTTAHRVKRGTKKAVHKGAHETGKAAGSVERKTDQ